MGVCPTCGAALDPGVRYCPACGWGRDETPVYRFGSANADGVAAVVAGSIPLVIEFSDDIFLTGWLTIIALGIWLLEIAVFFTLLRPYRTIRRALATVLLIFSMRTVSLYGCAALFIARDWPQQALLSALAAVGILVLQGFVTFAAYRKR